MFVFPLLLCKIHFLMVIHAALRRETLRKSQRPQHKELWARKEQNAPPLASLRDRHSSTLCRPDPLPAPLKRCFGFCTSAGVAPLLQPRAQLLGVRGLSGWPLTLMMVLRTELPRSGVQRGQVVDGHIQLQKVGIRLPVHMSRGPGVSPVAGVVATCTPACTTHVNLPGAGGAGIWGARAGSLC